MKDNNGIRALRGRCLASLLDFTGVCNQEQLET